MYKHIMLPVDGSDLSLKAAEECFRLAKAIGARVTALHVVAHGRLVIEEGIASAEVAKLKKGYEAAASKAAEAMLGKVKDKARAQGADCETLVVVADNPYEEIIGRAKDAGCDLIMMASHGRGPLQSLLLGSETAKVLMHSKLPVLVVR